MRIFYTVRAIGNKEIKAVSKIQSDINGCIDARRGVPKKKWLPRVFKTKDEADRMLKTVLNHYPEYETKIEVSEIGFW